MDASTWYWILGAVGAAASIIALLIFAIAPSWQRRASIVAVILIGLITIGLIATHHPETIAEIRVSHDAGTFEIADFLAFLSRGQYKVTMESRTLDDLTRRHTKISTGPLSDVSLQYVLERVLTPQLPGPEQWTYEVEGKTVIIKRR